MNIGLLVGIDVMTGGIVDDVGQVIPFKLKQLSPTPHSDLASPRGQGLLHDSDAE